MPHLIKRNIFLIIVILLAACTHKLPENRDLITIPLKFDDQNMPHIELEINAQAADFILDTGSKSGLHLTQEWINNWGDELRILPDQERSTDLSGRHIESKRFTIDRMSINGMAFEKIQGVELQPWGLELGQNNNEAPESQNEQKEMVIGLGLFTGKQILIDYSNQTLTIALPGIDLRSDPSSWTEIPWIMTEEGLVMKFMQNNPEQKYKLVLDTGASISLMSSQTTTALELLDCQSAGLDIDMGSMPCNIALLKPADFNLPQNDPLVALVLDMDFGKFEQHGLIGFNFFQNHQVLIDFSSQRIWISAPKLQ